MSAKTGMSRTAMLQRREQVKRLSLMGRKYWQIAEDLKVSTGTILRDLRTIKEEIAVQVKTEPQIILSMLVAEFDNVLKELWINYSNPENIKFRTSILTRIGEVVAKKSETFHKFGFAGVPENQINVQVNNVIAEAKKIVRFSGGEEEDLRRELETIRKSNSPEVQT